MGFENPQNNVDKSLRKYELVKNSFATWEEFLREVGRALKEVEGNENFKPGSRAFAKYLFGSHFDQTEYGLCSQAINEAIAEIKQTESKKQVPADNKKFDYDPEEEIREFEKQQMIKGAYGNERKYEGEAKALGINKDEIV